jgi:hypothetical protein
MRWYKWKIFSMMTPPKASFRMERDLLGDVANANLLRKFGRLGTPITPPTQPKEAFLPALEKPADSFRRSTGAFFAAMVKRAETGDLHLDRTLWAF